MSNAHWEHFPHRADIGIRGYGASLAEAFAQAAVAMTAVICAPEHVVSREPVAIRCEAPDAELLLVEFLNALIYEMAVRRMLFGRCEVDVHGNTLHAHCWGEAVDVVRHQPTVEIKGATYTELAVQYADGEWQAQCVVDV